MKAWWLSNGTLRHGDGRKANVGETHTVDGPLTLHRNGLHGSTSILATLNEGYGQYLYRTEHAGEVLREWSTVCSAERTYLWRVDCDVLFRKFARMCALDVIDNWKAPGLLVKWLHTGDEYLRGAAFEEAHFYTGSLADAKAGSAEELAGECAANAAAYRSALWDADRAACRAADSTAAAAAESAADSGAKPLARLLPYGTAYAAARKKQSLRLYRMVMAQHRIERETGSRAGESI